MTISDQKERLVVVTMLIYLKNDNMITVLLFFDYY